MQNMLSIRYAFCTCVKGVLCYLEPSIVFKANVARHVRILISLVKEAVLYGGQSIKYTFEKGSNQGLSQ